MNAGGPEDLDLEADLRAYLLGVLPPERQDSIEERFFADKELHLQLQATGDDLIHAYLAGELSPADRERFETHFLASPRRRERLAFVRSLMTAVDRVQSAARAPRRPLRMVSVCLPHFGQVSSICSCVTSLRDTDSFSPICAEKSFQNFSSIGTHSSLPLEMSSSSSSIDAVKV